MPTRKNPGAARAGAGSRGRGPGRGRTIFFTGFPGFIGKRLVRGLLAGGGKIDFIFLAEERFVSAALDETARVRAELGAGGEALRLEVLAGDISHETLGLDAGRYAALLGEITDVFHLAAIYDLHVPEDRARKVNVTGTRNIVELCRKAKKLSAFVYVSTCYVAGKRTGTCLEDELELGQGFKNHYESTKHEAEVIVRAAMPQVPTIIIRPSIVVGDSRTGETQKFDGPYFGMILVDALKLLQIPLPYLGSSTAEVNLVPIDFLIDATVALWKKKSSLGTCFALADPNPVLAKTLYAEIVRLMGARGPLGSIPPVLMEMPLRVAAIRKFLGVPVEVLDYFNHKAHYDTTNASAALKSTGITCPHILDYLPTLVNYYKKNKHRQELLWKAY